MSKQNFIILYRNEFKLRVVAENEKEAIKKAIFLGGWKPIGDLHPEYLEAFSEEE